MIGVELEYQRNPLELQSVQMVIDLHKARVMANETKLNEPSHVSTLRLFDAAREGQRYIFLLREWELNHLEACKDCQSVKETFDRQFAGQQKGPMHAA